MPPMTPPPTADDQVGAQVQDVPRTGKERVLGAVGGVLKSLGGNKTSVIEDKMQAEHDRRLNEARMHKKNASIYAGVLASGVNPDTGQPLTDEERQQYQHWYDASFQAYSKIAGVSKETKAAIQQQGGLINKVIAQGQQRQQAGAGGGTTGGPGTAPGATGAGASAISAGASAGMTPPPSADASPESPPARPTPPPATADEAALNAPRVAQSQEEQRGYKLWERQQNLLHQHKMEEQAALQKAKAQSGARPRPVHSGSIGVLDARALAAKGQVFMGEDGNPIDVSQLDPSMGLYGMVVRNDEGKWETQYTPFSPNQRTVTVGNETYAVSPMDISKMTGGAGADLGQHVTPKSGTHEAPMIGADGQPVAVPLHSTSTPSTPGIKGRTGSSGVTEPAAPRGLTPPPAGNTATPGSGAGAAGAKPRGAASHTPASSTSGARPLSALPPGTYNQMLQRVTPVRLAATQLFGDPQNPNFKPLAEYASIMDSPDSQQRIASAWNLIRKHMDDAGANEHSGDLITLMRNYAGTPGAVAESEAEKMKDTLDALKPREAEALNRLFSTYGTVIGLRSLTKGSAAKFSARNMEQEVPIPGMNVRTKRAFYDKLQTLAEEVNSGWKGVPDVMLTKGEREYDRRQQEELSRKAGGSGKGAGAGGSTPPPSGAKSPEDAADEYLKKYRKVK